MGNYPPPPYPPAGPPFGPPPGNDWKYQRRILKEQARVQRDMIRAQRDAYRYQTRGLRRSSILGPILLISIGVLFLLVQTGHLASHALWDWYGRFWPFLLIGAGVILVLEWTFDHYVQSDPTHPRYRRRIGGGVFTLLILFAIVGVVFSGMRDHNRDFLVHGLNLNQDNIDEFLGDKHESDQTLAQSFPTGAGLSVDNPRGDVTISGTSDDNQIHVSVHKEVYTRSDSEADTKAQRLTPTFTTSSDSVKLTVPALDGARADLTVTLPASAPISINANHGDVHVTSIKAPVAITANHGDIDLSAITGPVATHINNGDSSFSAHSITGPISLEGHGRDTTLSDLSGPVTISGDFFGATHFEHVRAPIKFHTSRTDFQLARLDGEVDISNNADLSASEAVGPLTLTTANRNITLERIAGDVAVTNRNGSVDLTCAPPLGNVTIENRNGSANVTVPEKSSFSVQADTTNGEVYNDFSLQEQDSDTHMSFSGKVGAGGPMLRITTSQGDIALKKASVMPLPPKPPTPPPLSITNSDGSSVYIGKDGVRVSSGAEGSSVIVGKDGVHINTNADGSSFYTSKDGARLTTNADGSYSLIGRDGLHFTSSADGSKVYTKGGVYIAIQPDGSQKATGSGGSSLTDSQIHDRIEEAEREAKQIAAQRDEERRNKLSRNK